MRKNVTKHIPIYLKTPLTSKSLRDILRKIFRRTEFKNWEIKNISMLL